MKIFFDNWLSLGRGLIIGVVTYAGLILFLRISGKRTLSKMNAFDLVATVALGSTFATALLAKDTSLVDGLFALALIIGLQFSVAWFSVRSERFRRWVQSEQTLLFWGDFLESKLRQQRVVREEVLSAVRAQGILNLACVEAVVLEIDGSLSVVKKSNEPSDITTLKDVQPGSEGGKSSD